VIDTGKDKIGSFGAFGGFVKAEGNLHAIEDIDQVVFQGPSGSTFASIGDFQRDGQQVLDAFESFIEKMFIDGLFDKAEQHIFEVNEFQNGLVRIYFFFHG